MSEAQTGRVSRLLGLSTTSPDSSEISNGKAIPRWGKKRVIFSVLAPCEHLGRGGSPQIPCRERSWLLSPSGPVNEDALAVPTSRAGLQREISAGGSGWGGTRPPPPPPPPAPWALATGRGKGSRWAAGWPGGNGKASEPLGPRRGRTRRCSAQGGPQRRPALVLGGPGGQEGSTGAGLPELESGSLLTGPAPAAGCFASPGSFFSPCETSQQT